MAVYRVVQRLARLLARYWKTKDSSHTAQGSVPKTHNTSHPIFLQIQYSHTFNLSLSLSLSPPIPNPTYLFCSFCIYYALCNFSTNQTMKVILSLLYLAAIQTQLCFCFATLPDSQMLVLPLRIQQIPSGSFPRSSNKHPFHHNVTLTVSLSVGTPPQNVTMVLDTGSELSWLHCNETRVSQPSFDPTNSSSYSPITCSSPTCMTRTQDFPIPASCDSNKHCHATLSYADASSSEGNLATDIFNIGGSGTPGTIFGCMDSGFSSNSDEDMKTTGLMGMNRGGLSFVSQMNFPKFSYCISGSDFSAYTVQLQGIKVSEKVLPLPKSILEPDHTGAGQTMVDSGTQFTFLLGPAYDALRNEFLNQTNGSLRVLDDPNFVFQGAMDLCYLVPLNQTSFPVLPSVSIMFGGAEMSISGDKLLYRVPGEIRGNNSVYCLTFGNSDLLGIEAYVIGHHHQQNVWMEFDLENSRIGFAQVRCDLASQRFGLYH